MILPANSTSTWLEKQLQFESLKIKYYPKLLKNKPAKVAELADALDLGSSPARGRGSTPLFRTNSPQALQTPASLPCFQSQTESNTLRSIH
jgi:hypothetical protein